MFHHMHGCPRGLQSVQVPRRLLSNTYNTFFSADVGPIQHPSTKQQTDELDKEFRSIVGAAFDAIKSQDLTPADFRERVSRLGTDHQPEHSNFIKEDLIGFQPNATVVDIWIKLDTYWNYFNYGLLEHVIDEFGIESLLQRMQRYIESLESFKKETKLIDFIERYRKLDHIPSAKKLKELKVKKESPDWARCTLWEVEEFKTTLITKFFIPKEFLLVFKDATEGCICITWLVLPSIASMLQRAFKGSPSDLHEMGIKEVYLDEHKCYPSVFNSG